MKSFFIILAVMFGHLGVGAAPPLHGTSRNDRDLTQMVREQLIRDSNLSIYAQNIKIITLNGQVILRGPVLTRAEANRIVNRAESVVGVTAVVNELEVVAK